MKISVEFAHTSLPAIDVHDIRRSAQTALSVIGYLRDQGHAVNTVILVDDKKVDRAAAHLELRELLKLLDDEGCPPDAWFFERDLRHHLPALKPLLPPGHWRRTEKEARAYLRKFDNLPCSVDIALWHSLRLGLLPFRPLGGFDAAISILGDSNKEFEDRAREKILAQMAVGDPSRRAIPLYYPDSATVPFTPESLIPHLAQTLKEIDLCPAS